MGNGKISSFPVSLTFSSGNQSEAVRNHPRKELYRSNTAITVTSHTYLPLWLYSQIHQRLNQSVSRLPFQTWLPERQDRAKLEIHAITRQLPVTADRLKQFLGWPQDTHDLLKEIQLYWTFHKEMTIGHGLLLKGTHIIIPQTLCQEMIQLLHTGHLALAKCLNKAKQSMYWPGLYEELKDLVTNCMTCLKFSTQKPTSNRQYTGHEIPVHPWLKLAFNIFYFDGDSYLLIVDYTSHFAIIRKLSSMTGKAITHHMQSIFPNTDGPTHW